MTTNKAITREQVEEFIKSHIGDTLPMCTLGNGGAGLDMYQLNDESINNLINELSDLAYNGVVEPAEDFDPDDMGFDLDDFEACVEFEKDGYRLQMLVWDIYE